MKSYVPTEYKELVDSKENFHPYDVAVMQVASNGQGATLENILGMKAKTLVRDVGAPREGATYGYPAMGGKKYNGSEMFYCFSSLRDVRPDGEEVTPIQAPSCAVQGGNSGGPVYDGHQNIVAVTQSREPIDGNPNKAYSAYARLHPDTFSLIRAEANKDAAEDNS